MGRASRSLEEWLSPGHDGVTGFQVWCLDAPLARWRTAVEHYAGLDVSLELTSVCIVDAQGGIVCEAKVASEPAALTIFLCARELDIPRVGLEGGPPSQWPPAGLVGAGFETVLLETRHVKAA